MEATRLSTQEQIEKAETRIIGIHQARRNAVGEKRKDELSIQESIQNELIVELKKELLCQ